MELVEAEFEPDGEIVNGEHIQSHAIGVNEGIIEGIAACLAFISISGIGIGFGKKAEWYNRVGP